MWSGRWLNKHLKECLQSVISRSALNFSSQPALRTTVCDGLRLARCHRRHWRLRLSIAWWNSLLYAPTVRPPCWEKKKKKNKPQVPSGLQTKNSLLHLNNGFLKHRFDDVLLPENSKLQTHKSYLQSKGAAFSRMHAGSVSGVSSAPELCLSEPFTPAKHLIHCSLVCLSTAFPYPFLLFLISGMFHFSVFVCCLKSFTEWGKAYIN